VHNANYETAVGTVSWAADDQKLCITFKKRTEQLRWDEITSAGLVHFASPDIDPDLPTDILPGLGKLFSLNRSIAKGQHQLVLARGKSVFRAFRVPIPIDQSVSAALVETVQQKLGTRWIGEMPITEHQKALGLRTPWWFYPIFVVGFVAFGYLILFAIGAFSALTSGQFVEVPWIAWLALLVWVILIGWILFQYRRWL
jgi:hypothetical protein